MSKRPKIEDNPKATEAQVTRLYKRNPTAAMRHPCCPIQLAIKHPEHYQDIQEGSAWVVWAIETPGLYAQLCELVEYHKAVDGIKEILNKEHTHRDQRRILSWCLDIASDLSNGHKLVHAQYGSIWHKLHPMTQEQLMALTRSLRYARRVSLGLPTSLHTFKDLFEISKLLVDENEQTKLHHVSFLYDRATMLRAILYAAGMVAKHCTANKNWGPPDPIPAEEILKQVFMKCADVIQYEPQRAKVAFVLRWYALLEKYMKCEVAWYERVVNALQ